MLGHHQGVVRLHAEVIHRALQRRVPQQQLASPQVARPPVDQRDIRPAQAVRAIACRVEADQRHPLIDEPAVLTRRKMLSESAPAGKAPSRRLSTCA